jgi:hypothetical protein
MTTTAYHSTMLDHPVDVVWQLIRDFNNYPAYIDGVTESVIEDGRRGDEVGAVRRFHYGDLWIRQRLSAHSDQKRILSYQGMEPVAYPDASSSTQQLDGYEGTMHLLPIVDGNRTFIEWSVAIDTAASGADAWRKQFESWIPGWAESLRRALANRQKH